MDKNIGQAHNELLAFMTENHDIATFRTFDQYAEYQYDYLSAEYPELAELLGKDKFVELVLSTLNSNNISDFDYKKSVEITLEKAKDLNNISEGFYSEVIRILNDDSVDGSNIEERFRSVEVVNKLEETSVSYFLDIAQYSQVYWQNEDVTGKRNWVVWGADAYGGLLGSIGATVFTANPIVGWIAGIAVSELMSAAVGAAQGHH